LSISDIATFFKYLGVDRHGACPFDPPRGAHKFSGLRTT